MASKQSPNAQSTNNGGVEPLWTAVDLAAWAQINPGTVRNLHSQRRLPEPRGSPRILRLRSDGKLVPPGRPALSLGSVVQISAWELDDSQSRAMSRYRDPEPGRPGR
jgi:hypothetical protein